MIDRMRPVDWRYRLRRGIGWTLLIKLIALIALWVLFFSPADRVHVTPSRVDSRLVIEAPPESPND
jgi:uncharacterized membrane protein